MGFYTARWVEAQSAEEAELAALAMLQAEYQFSEQVKARTPNARVYFEKVYEVDPRRSKIGRNKGAIWFPMKS